MTVPTGPRVAMMRDLRSQIKSFWQASCRRRWLLVGALWLAWGLYVVRPEQEAVVRLLGRVVAPAVAPGLHWRPPWPITRLNKVKISEAKRLSVGFDLADEASGRQPPPGRSHFLTGDQNIVNIQVVVQYCVERPATYLFRAAQIEQVVAAVVERELTRAVQGQTVDWVLTTGRAELQDTVRREAGRQLAAYDVGVRLLSTNVRAAYPPAEVSDAFKAVAGARADRDRIIDQAQGYANEVVEQALGQADKERSDAEAYRAQVVAEAEGDAARFRQVYQEYARAPQVTRKRLYLETMELLTPRMKVIVAEPTPGQPLDLGILGRPPEPNVKQGTP